MLPKKLKIKQSLPSVQLVTLARQGLAKYYFLTWTERNGQDDLRWYEGTKTKNGEYSITINNKDHGFETGAFKTHTYIYGLQGEILKVLDNTIDLAKSTSVIAATEVANNGYKIKIKGISNNAGINSVVVPTWSHINGHDDLWWESHVCGK